MDALSVMDFPTSFPGLYEVVDFQHLTHIPVDDFFKEFKVDSFSLY